MRLVLLVPWLWLGASAQDFTLAAISKIATGYRFTEGAAWSKDGFLIFSDTAKNQLFKWVPGHAAEIFRENANGPSGNVFDAQGRLYTCETRARRVTRTDRNGNIEILAERWEGKRLNAPSAIAIAKSGQVYFTDSAFGYQSDNRELDFYGVYRIPQKGPLQLVAKLPGRPRGVALSPNGRTLYVSEADDHRVLAYDLDRNGEASGERILIADTEGVPGGISVDEAGNLYVAANGVSVYNSEGRLLRTIPTRDPASSVSFGDADSKSLFVTARGDLYRLRPGEK
ncbi:MAG: SMP-30/gluconolactonase/LRE family protein [Acidobacteriia bacterium]|nr:SMP-30/gluconolactonase/LRE family protein [Terriglobia bacterium]